MNAASYRSLRYTSGSRPQGVVQERREHGCVHQRKLPPTTSHPLAGRRLPRRSPPPAIIEWPQSGERIRGKQQIIALHEAAPFAVDIVVRRTIGSGDLWVTETTISYHGGRPTKAVFIMEFRDGKVVRETDYFGEPFAPPDYRSKCGTDE